MFNVGDYIVYGNNVVCEVENVGPLKSAGMPKDKVYYTLTPYYSRESKIFIPADNTKIMMRPILTKDEALNLIDEMKDIDLLGVEDERRRETDYKEALKKCDCRELVKIIKSIYSREQDRIAEGKKVTASDDRYFHMAEESLYGELAVSLDMDKDSVKEFVVSKLS